LISWLRDSQEYPKIYWRSPKEEIAACGIDEQADASQPWFYLPSFCSKGKESSFFFAPRKVHRKTPQPFSIAKRHYAVVSRTDAPDLYNWKKHIAATLQHIDRKEFDKVVLGRKTSLRLDSCANPFDLLFESPNCTTFLFQPSPDIAFLGSTPEMLYRREGRNIVSDAIAGTRPRGKTTTEDAKLREDLLLSDKERREFAYVQQFIHAELSPLCETLNWTDIGILKTPSVQHLHSQLTGFLKEHVTDSLLLETLHPTPAIAGLPRKNALLHLQDIEPFARGWYGAPIGWISKEKSELAVAIRSALIQKNDVHLFAAVGIVKGSHPELEWEELNHKISPWIEVFS